MASPNIDRFPIKVRHINRHKQNVRIYILCHNELRLKYTIAKFGSFYWAVPILMKYTDCTFDNAFWKQLLEIKDEWINCTMVGVISSKVAMNLDLNAVNSVIQEPTQWTDGFYNFKCTDVIDSPNTVIIVNHVYNVLYMPIPTQSNINCWMCRPTLMEQFILWFEDTLKPTVMMHRLIITDPTYRENLIKQKALKLCGTPLHPLASSVIDRLTKVFFDGLNNPYSTQEQNFSKFPTLFHKYNLQLSRPDTPIQYEVIQSTCKDDKPICHLHIHDIQNVQQYTDYMNMICEEYYIIVTFNTGTIQTIDTNITYIKVPNKGFDIGPKICAIHFLKTTGLAYEYILFLHSKSDIEIRKKLYDPLVKNAFRIKLLSYLMKIQPQLLGIFPDWCFSESVRRGSYDPYISNIACTAELLRYIGIYKFDKIFAAGNCMILRKNVIDRIFSNNLDVFYNSLNELTSFDYNWFKVKHRLGHELSVKQVYDKYVSMNTAGNNLACMHTSESLPDAMIEHAFERIWLNVISDMKGEYLILTEDNISTIEQTQIQPCLTAMIDINGDNPSGMISDNSDDIHDTKAAFRHFCVRYLKYIRLFTIPPILRTCKKEAVLIEYRKFSHLEFLLRNMILKLGVDWSYTVVCGILNYGLMRTMCTNIHPNINLIVTPYDNLTPSLYSTFLASVDFWSKLHGDKILIYQEDSIIFKNNINDFLQWDYIGAPWPRHQNDTPNGVGNGGFSLRTRKVMLDVISRKTIADTLPNKSTLEYIANTKSDILPEDVYFSKNIQELGLGKVAPWHVAYDFSTETQYNPNSLGGHNFWINDSQWKNRLYKNIVINYACKTKLKTTHRGGWEYILNTMKEHNILESSSENELLSVTEEVYLWHNYELRPKKRWIGFIHCTPIAPEYLDVINISFLPKSTMFLEDIVRCDGLYCLSEYVSEYLRKNIPNPPRIITLMHPVVFDDIPLFTMEKYEANSDKYILQIGQQLRKVTSIFKIFVPGFKRLWLTGNPDMNQCKEMIIREGGSGDYSMLHYTKTFEEYDAFLEKNIVFIELFDSAANNTVLECIVRNTPIILNRTPGVIEYLGADYPLYFDHLDEVAGLMAIEKLAAAHRYLKLMNKEKFTIEYFMRAFVNSFRI